MKQKTPELEVVVASYKEPLEWLEWLPKGKGIKHTIYRATDDLLEVREGTIGPKKIPVIHIPNGGREAGQYLWHIVHNYKTLAKLTVFLQGDAPRHATRKTLETLTPIRFWDDTRKMAYLNVSKEHDRVWPHELTDLHRSIHDVAWGKNPPKGGMFSVGAQMWVTHALIRSNPKSHYETYLKLRQEPHFAHILESSWHVVFGAYKDSWE